MNKTLLHNSLIAGLLAMSHTPVFAEEYGLVLEEIIVTAQKRTENLQDVPASIVAFTNETFDNNAITEFADTAKLIPGLTLSKSNATNTQIRLRGIQYDRNSAASEAVDVYWNSAVYQASAIFASMYDIERLEVLRGPQGTLQGKTSPGGAIIIHTRKPVVGNGIEGQIKTVFDEAGSKFVEAGISVSVSDTLAIRVAGYSNNSEGNGIQSVVNGDESDADAQGGRISVVWEPTEDFDLALQSEYLSNNTQNYWATVGTAGNGFGGGTDQQDFELSDRKSQQGIANTANLNSDVTVLTTNWRGLENHEITYVGSYSETSVDQINDVDRTSQKAYLAGGTTVGDGLPSNSIIGGNILSHELRIASQDRDVWNYTAGLYYSQNKVTTTVLSNRNVQNAGIDRFNQLAQLDLNNNIAIEEFGIFTHNYIELTESSELQVGLRYNKIRRADYADTRTLVGGVNVSGDTVLANRGNADEAFTGGVKYINYLTDDLMAYVSVDTSYRPSGAAFNPFVTDPDNTQDLIFNDENTTALELGFKSTLMDGRMQLNAAFYYQEINEYQGLREGIDINGDNAIGAGEQRHQDRTPTFLTANADATSIGAEIESKYLISEAWSAGLALSYNDFTYDDGESSFCNEVGHNFDTGAGGTWVATCDIGGERVGDAPNWSVSATSEYVIPMGGMEAYVRGLYKYDGATTATSITDPAVARQGGFGTLDLFAGIRADQWTASVWVKNVTDKLAETKRYKENDLSSAQVSPTATADYGNYREASIIPERTIGASLSYNFDL